MTAGAPLLCVALAATVAACANMGAPPGGPPRTTPPELLLVTPESGAVNANARGVVFSFDEVVNDRDVEKFFLLSPELGRTRVYWRRDRVEVRPRHGFLPNTAYSVTMLPGLTDLRGNTLRTGRTVVFSTGPAIPPYTIFGRVFDWMNERVAAKAVVQAIRRPDSLPYVGLVDSAGQFGVGPLAPAPYTVIGFVDNNANRTLDRGEIWDSVQVSVGGGTSPFLELLAAPRDTVPPRLITLVSPDTFTIVATFDKPLHPDWEPRPDRFRVVSADSTLVGVATARRKSRADSARGRADSARAAVPRVDSAVVDTTTADTTRADTTVRRDTTTRRDTAALRRGGPVVAPPPRPSRPAPSKEVTLKLDSLTPLHPGTAYRVTAIEVRGLLGGGRNTERVFTVPRARVDSTRARGDSAGVARDTTRVRPDSSRQLKRPPSPRHD